MSAEAPTTKLDEQRARGYTAWDRQVDNPIPVAPPKLLDPEEARKLEAETAAAAGASAWNAANMFEERCQLAWLKEQLAARVTDLKATHSGSSIAVTEVEKDSVQGHAMVIFSRGKKKYGFDLEQIKFKYEAKTPGGSEIKGTITVKDANSDDLDDLELSVDNGALKGVVAGAFRGVVITCLQQILADLKQR